MILKINGDLFRLDRIEAVVASSEEPNTLQIETNNDTYCYDYDTEEEMQLAIQQIEEILSREETIHEIQTKEKKTECSTASRWRR